MNIQRDQTHRKSVEAFILHGPRSPIIHTPIPAEVASGNGFLYTLAAFHLEHCAAQTFTDWTSDPPPPPAVVAAVAAAVAAAAATLMVAGSNK